MVKNYAWIRGVRTKKSDQGNDVYMIDVRGQDSDLATGDMTLELDTSVPNDMTKLEKLLEYGNVKSVEELKGRPLTAVVEPGFEHYIFYALGGHPKKADFFRVDRGKDLVFESFGNVGEA